MKIVWYEMGKTCSTRFGQMENIQLLVEETTAET
jgi:hypothetical protein